MFIGREKELENLERHYRSEKEEFIVMYGRRRVGKTTILNEFLKGKNGAYYMATKENASANLIGLSEAISGAEGTHYESFDRAFREVASKGKEERYILVIDEYPYFAESAPEISSLLQRALDHLFKGTKVMLILCGSSMSFMEHQVLGYQSPLYGRRSSQMKIKPFNFFECQAFLPDMDKEELMGIYAITGGIPQYLDFMDATLNLKENVIQNFLMTSAPLYEEPNNLLLQELRDPSNYNAVLYAIAHGASRVKEISDKVNLSSSTTLNFLANLIELGIVEKKSPMSQGFENSKKTIYQISDTMFRFWYRFVGRNQSQIEQDKGELVYQKIEKEFNDFLGPVFERVCMDWMWQHLPSSERVDDYFQDLGSWWGTNPKEKRAEEIDIVGFSPETNAVFLGECKWRNQLTEVEVLETLVKRGDLFSNPQKYYFLFSKSGFQTACQEKAEQIGAHLIQFSEMMDEQN